MEFSVRAKCAVKNYSLVNSQCTQTQTVALEMLQQNAGALTAPDLQHYPRLT